jgi:hypothetical protein
MRRAVAQPEEQQKSRRHAAIVGPWQRSGITASRPAWKGEREEEEKEGWESESVQRSRHSQTRHGSRARSVPRKGNCTTLSIVVHGPAPNRLSVEDGDKSRCVLCNKHPLGAVRPSRVSTTHSGETKTQGSSWLRSLNST